MFNYGISDHYCKRYINSGIIRLTGIAYQMIPTLTIPIGTVKVLNIPTLGAWIKLDFLNIENFGWNMEAI